MSFYSEWAFLLYLPLILFLVLFFWGRQQKTPTLQFSNVSMVKSLRKGWRAQIWWLPEILKYIGIAFVIYALARPRTADTVTKKNIEGIDIMIALDISDSMLIEDMKPLNRIEAAKETIRNFVKGRTSDRIGMIIFAGESFTLVPLTLDYDLVLSRVADVTTALEAHIKDGTAIGVALANAAGKLKDSTAKTKVLIFLTDGENNSGLIDPETGLEIVKGFGIKTYSIGLGSSGPTKIPIYQKDVFGNRVKTYQPFESTVNDDLLGRMASETGGKYYRASKEDSLGPIFKDINQLEKTKMDINSYTLFTELFQKYLLTGFWLYVLGLLLNATIFRRAV